MSSEAISSSSSPSDQAIDNSAVLSSEDIDHFMEFGYTVVRQAFPRDIAFHCRDILWEEISKQSFHAITRDNQYSWDEYVKIAMDRTYWPEDGLPWNQVFTDRLTSAINQICSMTSPTAEGQTHQSLPFGAGWWMITFPKPQLCFECGSDGEEEWAVEGAWHIDGNNYPRYPFSNEVGVVLVMYFSDVDADGGGTAVAEESHRNAIQLLSKRGCNGITKKEITKELLSRHIKFNVTELTGSAGDVFILHPLLLHARSSNLGPYDETGVRFMCHPSVGLKDPLSFDKPVESMSVLERMIYNEFEKFHMLEHLKLLTPEAIERYRAERASASSISSDEHTTASDDMLSSWLQRFEAVAAKKMRTNY
jgi:hypothetical protein